MRRSPAFTLVEILVVITIIGLLTTVAFFSLITSRANQALSASAEQAAEIFRRAHIFSREAKDHKTWGVKSDSQGEYMLITYTSTPTAVQEEKKYQLERGISFIGNFNIWFARGTGEPDMAYTVELINHNQVRAGIVVTTIGAIDVVPL